MIKMAEGNYLHLDKVWPRFVRAKQDARKLSREIMQARGGEGRCGGWGPKGRDRVEFGVQLVLHFVHVTGVHCRSGV